MRVSEINHQKPNTAKNVAKVATGAAVAAGTVLYLAKKGKLNPTEGGNKHVETLKAALKKPADKVLNSDMFTKVSGKFSKLTEKINDNKIVSNIKDAACYVKDVVADKVESIFNKGKFKPETISKIENPFK